MRPEFAEALKKSISFSSMIIYVNSLSIVDRGKSASLLKPSSKLKRKRSEIEEVKEEEKKLKDDRQQFLKDYKRMKHS